MNTCEKFNNLPLAQRDEISWIIQKRMCGKSHISDISIEESKLAFYEFMVTVGKYSNSGNRGWATIGYFRQSRPGKPNSVWVLTFKPKVASNEKSEAGRTGTYP